MRLSLWPPFPRVNSRRWRSQTFLTLYTRSWWDPLRTKKPSEKLLPKHDFFEHGARVKNCPTFCNLIFNVYSNSVSIKCISYISYMQLLKKCHSLSKSPLKKTAKKCWLEHVSIILTTYESPHFPLLSWSGLWGVESLVMSDGLHLLRLAHGEKSWQSSCYGKQTSGYDIQNPMIPVSTRKKMVQRISDKFEF